MKRRSLRSKPQHKKEVFLMEGCEYIVERVVARRCEPLCFRGHIAVGGLSPKKKKQKKNVLKFLVK